MDKPNSIEPHKTSQTPAEEEWRGGDQRRGREAQERSSERGWGTGKSEAGDGHGRQQGQGGARGGDLGDREGGGQDEKGDASRRQGRTSDRAGSGQGSTKN
jgi:hypothetical protein